MSGERIERLRAATYWPQESRYKGHLRSDSDMVRVSVGDIREALSSLRGEACTKCDDSGFVELASGGIWTGENITTRREYCDCACGQDARDQADGVGMHAAHPSPDSDVIGRLVGAARRLMEAETHALHVGYDHGSGGGNYVYADAIRTDDEAFVELRQALASHPDTVLPRPRRNASPSEVKTGRQGIGEE